MKKALALLLAAAMCTAVLAGCGAGGGAASSEAAPASSEAEAPAESEAPEEEPAAAGGDWVIGFSNCSTVNTWRTQLENEFRYRADQLVADGTIKEYIMLNADNDVSHQIADIQDLITKKVDAIIVTCINEDSCNAVLEEAKDSGIVVVNCDQASNADFFDAKIVGSNYDIGYQCAEFIIDNTEPGAKILQLDGIAGSFGSEAACQGMEDAQADRGVKLNIVQRLNCDWDYATAKTAVEDALVANPEIDGVLSQGGAMTQAAMEVFIAQGKPLVPMSGEGNNGFCKLWKENVGKDKFKSFAFVIPTWQAAEALDVAVKILNGETVEKDQLLTHEGITEETLDDYVRMDCTDALWLPTILDPDTVTELYGE